MGTELVEALVLGILAGSIYGLFSVGLSLVFGVMRLVNFAYGDFVMAGSYVAYEIAKVTHASLYLAIPVVLVGSVPIGAAIYVIFFKGVGRQGGSHEQLLISLGLSVLIENGVVDVFGSTPVAATNQTVSAAVHLGPIGVPVGQIIAFGLAIVLTAATQWALAGTAVGRALRALVSDREMATLVGVRTGPMFTMAFIASVALAGVAGVALLGYLPATSDSGQNFILLGFVCVILGGVGDTRGAFLAGLVVGVIESLTTTFWQPQLQDTVVYAVFIAAILIRPGGLLGTATE